MDSIEAMAIGLVCAGLMLLLLQEITSATPLREALGKLVYEGVPFAIGVALANQVLRSDQSDENLEATAETTETDSQQSKALINATLSDIGSAAIGATVIAFNIAPTDEISLLAGKVNHLNLLAVMLASLIISYAIVFEAGFTNQLKRQQQRGIFQRPLSETFSSYLVSLFLSILMLAFFGKLHWHDPWQQWLSHSILLSLPATIGGAAGRLAI
jgi:putative integral membrane protein (TIGR02587 family)